MWPSNGDGRGSEKTRKKISSSSKKPKFFPEESFQSWNNYGRALREIPARLMDRFMTRSLKHTELVELKARSQYEMKKILTWWDLVWFGVGAVVGAGIFVLTGLETRNHTGPAVILSYIVSGFSALLSVLCYTEFAVEIPSAGGSFAYLRVELGDFVAFFAAGNILLEYVIGGATVARSWTSYFATLCNYRPRDFRIHVPSFSENFNQLDPVAIVIIAIVCIFAVVSIKGSSRLNYIATIIQMGIIIFIIIAGLTKANPKNLTPFAPFGAHGVFQASAILYFSYIGFDAVSTMAEETISPGIDMPIGLISSVVIAMFVYVTLAITLCLMQSYKEIDPDAPFSVAFEAVGWGWAKYIVAGGALKGMTTVLLVGAVGQARYLTHVARTHMMSPWFAVVDKKTETPVNATVSMLLVTAVLAFFMSLSFLSSLLCISTLVIFVLVAVALIVRRYYVSGETTVGNRNKLILCLLFISASSTATAIYGGTSNGWIAYTVTLPIWFVATAVLWLIVPQAKKPEIWGVPFVPWLPSVSIAVNLFLLGSVDKMSFFRFGIWTILLMIYYFLFGLHASYDAAMASKDGATAINAANDV